MCQRLTKVDTLTETVTVPRSSRYNDYMTETESATDRAMRLDGEWSDFIETLAGGALVEHLAWHGKPHPEDVARIMREGPRLPEMTLDGWLVKGELHWVF